MAGIYIHIPFCRSRCHYCDFYSSTVLNKKEELIEAMRKEIHYRSDFVLSGTELETIYFGGGTPSLFNSNELNSIIQSIYNNFNIHPKAEITLEANPDDLNREYLRSLKNTIINRLSIGIQSFEDNHLKLMNRRHTAREALYCVENARSSGIENISIDLIYGIPGMTMEQWKANVQKAIETKAEHISAYHLTFEPNTYFHTLLKRKTMKEVDENTSLLQYQYLVKKLNDYGIKQYEISNFCKPDKHSRHNTNYWKNVPYLGVGPSAHSYDVKKRYWNVASIDKYISYIDHQQLWYEEELLTEKDRINEYLMTSLRTINGLNREHLKKHFDTNLVEKTENKLLLLAKTDLMTLHKNHYAFTKKGFFMSDGLIADLFVV